MKVLVHDYGGYPFTVQLARSLAGRGHEVLYLYSRGFVTPKGPMLRRINDPASIRVEAVELDGRTTRSAGFRRYLQERRYGSALAQRLRQFRPDAVLSANCPLDSQSSALAATRDVGGAFVFWMQDYYSLAVKQLLHRRGQLLGRLVGARFARLERRLLRSSDAVVAVSAEFLPVLTAWGIPDGRIQFVPNWAPLDAVGQVGKKNDWSSELDLDSRPVVAYTGTLGRKHNPALLTALARALPMARVVVVSEGVGTEWLRRHAGATSNLLLLPLQPAERMPDVLGTADVLVALLEEDAADFSEPSKVLTYLAAGRPIIAAIPSRNQAAKTIIEAGAGIVVDPSDTTGLVEAARRLLADADARRDAGVRGRAYAESRFAIGPITDRFESLLHHHLPRSARAS